jgi:hypothetical protein
MVLKENTNSKESLVDRLHKVFNSDDRLSSSEITKLLGNDVLLTDLEDVSISRKHQILENSSALIVFILSLLIAFSSIGYLMYKEKAGVFHETETAPNVK